MRTPARFLHVLDAPVRLAALHIAGLPADRWHAIENLMAEGTAFEVIRIAYDAALIAPSPAMQALIDGDALPPEPEPTPEAKADEKPVFITEMEQTYAEAR